MEDVDNLISNFFNDVIKPKYYRNEFKQNYSKLKNEGINLFKKFDKDLTQAKIIKKLIQKNLEKLKHQTWSFLNLTDNLFHEHDGEIYFNPHKGINYLNKEELLEIYAKKLNDFKYELTHPEKANDYFFLKSLNEKYNQAINLFIQSQEMYLISKVKFLI
jgi:hypothetical protein